MEYLTLIGTVTLVHLLAVVTPGPDFVMTVKNSLTHSRNIGVWTAVGLGMGVAVHVFYSLTGLALLISKSLLLFNVIKFLGAGYLVYIGLKAMFSKSVTSELNEQSEGKDMSSFEAIRLGFLTNILNPKVTLFFLSLFTLVISPETPLPVMVAMGVIMVINTILWFSLVAVFLSQKRIRTFFEKYQRSFNKTLGGVLVALGVKVALIER